VNGAYQAVEAIINRGHRKIGMIAGPRNVYTAKERLEGYLRALKDYNIEVDDSLIYYSDYTKLGGYQAVAKLYESNEMPTVIFTSNYEMTIGAIKFLNEHNVAIGEDISFFGYDQMELSQIIMPPISFVVQSMEMIGRKAAETLINRMKGDQTGFPLVNRLKTEIIVTDSVKKLC
jgi:LacI family transcriptional regulator